MTYCCRCEVKQDLSDVKAFPCISKCPSYLKVNFCCKFLVTFELNFVFPRAISDASIAGERATGKYVPSGVPLVTEEGHSNTETVRSSEPTNVPTQIVDGTIDSDSIIRINDTLPKKRKSVGPAASGRKKKAYYNISETIENALYEMFSAATFKAAQRNSLNEKTLYQKCLEDLQKLEELDDIEFANAVNVLKDDKNAIAFMTIKGPRRLIWLRSLWQAQ